MKSFSEFLLEREAPVRVSRVTPTYKPDPDAAMRNVRKDFEDKLDTDKPAPGKKITPGKFAGGPLGFADVRSDQKEGPQPNRNYDRRITKLRDELFSKGGDGYQYDPEISSESESQYHENKFNQLNRLSGILGNQSDKDHIDKIKNIIGVRHPSADNYSDGFMTPSYHLNDRILDVIENGKFDLNNEDQIEFLKNHVYEFSEDDSYENDLKALSKLDFSNPGVNAVIPGLRDFFNKYGDTEGYEEFLDRDDLKTMISNLSDDNDKGIDRSNLRLRLQNYQKLRDLNNVDNYMFNDDPDFYEANDIHDVMMGMMSGRLDGDDIEDLFNDYDEYWDIFNTEDYNDGDNYNYANPLLQSISRNFNNNDFTPAILSSLVNVIGDSGENLLDDNRTMSTIRDMLNDDNFNKLLKQNALDTIRSEKSFFDENFEGSTDEDEFNIDQYWENHYNDDKFIDNQEIAQDFVNDYDDLSYDLQSALNDYMSDDLSDNFDTFEEVLETAQEWIENNNNEVQSSDYYGDHVEYSFTDNTKWDYDLDTDTIDSIKEVADKIGVTPYMRRYIEWSENVNEDDILDKWEKRFGKRPPFTRGGQRREELINFGKQIAIFDALKTWRRALEEMEPGTVLENNPMSGGAGDNMREVLYNKMGFGRDDGGQYGIVGNEGKVYPVNDFSDEEKKEMKLARQAERAYRDKKTGIKSNIGRKAGDADDKFREKFPQTDEPIQKVIDIKDKLMDYLKKRAKNAKIKETKENSND